MKLLDTVGVRACWELQTFVYAVGLGGLGERFGVPCESLLERRIKEGDMEVGLIRAVELG